MDVALIASAPVATISSDGVILGASGCFVGLTGLRASEVEGRRLADLCPSGAAAERADQAHQALDSNSPVRYFEALAGMRCQTTVAPVPAEHGGDRATVYMTVRPASAAALRFVGRADSIPTLRTPIFGCWDRMTAVELEVFRHIGLELTNDEIAKAMNRSRRAIEWHTRNLLRKLGVGTRLGVFCAAYGAGIGEFTTEEWAAIVANRRPSRRGRTQPAIATPERDRIIEPSIHAA